MTPQRIQRKRTAGWRMPPNTVSVTRPGPFGNPWSVTWTKQWLDCGNAEAQHTAVRWFREWMIEGVEGYERERERLLARLPELRGKNLACFCEPGQPCHADVLLEIANAQTPG